MSEIDALGEQIAALEEQMRGARSVAGSFESELSRMREGMVFADREVAKLTVSLGGGLRKAFDGLVFDGMRLSDALRQVAKSMVDQVYSAAMRPVQNAVGGTLAQGLNNAMSGVVPFANGGAFTQGRVMPFAQGGIVSGPVNFPMRGGRGLMGEAGPEAIMPLTRGADGKLGVQAAGGGRAVNVVINVSTPDVQGFQRSQSQIAAQMARALGRGERNR